ncbi:MAG TPA: hypothetical protein VEB21_14565 [Terriglobales bacterium]|nr:hypothetical protein [Terriglobales bacterium]
MNMRVIAAAAAGALITGLCLWAYARWSASHDDGRVPLTELARRYRYWEIAGVVLVLLSIAASALLLLAVARRYPPAYPGEAFRLTVPPLYWIAVAFFAGNLLATGPTHLLYAWLLGERFAEFREYQARKFGFDSVRWMLPFYLVFGGVTAAVTAALLDWYVVFRADDMIVDHLVVFAERSYPYDELLEIRAAPRFENHSGDIEERWTFVLHFDDGHFWSSLLDPSHASEARLREIAGYVSAQSGLPITEVAVLHGSELRK